MTQGNSSSSAKIPTPSHSKVGLNALSEGNTSGEPEEDALKQQLVEITPGSPEAEDLMQSLEENIKKLHLKNKTSASLLGIFAKALWKDCQGTFYQCNFYDVICREWPFIIYSCYLGSLYFHRQLQSSYYTKQTSKKGSGA